MCGQTVQLRTEVVAFAADNRREPEAWQSHYDANTTEKERGYEDSKEKLKRDAESQMQGILEQVLVAAAPDGVRLGRAVHLMHQPLWDGPS